MEDAEELPIDEPILSSRRNSNSSVETLLARTIVKDDVIEALELIRNTLTACLEMLSHRNDEDMLISLSKSALTALYSVQQVCNMRYIFQNNLVEKGAPKMVLRLLTIFSEPLLLQKKISSNSTSLESKNDGDSVTSTDNQYAVVNPYSNDVLIECCSTIRYLCTNHNDCKTILGSNGICQVVTSIAKYTDSIPLLDMCLKLVIDLLNSVRPSAGNRLSDNSDLFGEAGICEVLYRVLDDRQSSSTTAPPFTADLTSATDRKLFIAACDAISNLSGSKGNCIRFGEADIPTILTNRMKGKQFSEEFISECSYELWVKVLWTVIRLCSENRAQNKAIFIREGAAEVIFSKLNEFFEDLDVKLTYSRAQTFVEYSAWALHNMVFYNDGNLKYLVENIPTCGLLMGDFLELDEIGASAKAKISLLSDKLQAMLKICNPQVDTDAVVPPPSRRGRSRGEEGKEEDSKEGQSGAEGEDEEDEEEDWNFNDS